MIQCSTNMLQVEACGFPLLSCAVLGPQSEDPRWRLTAGHAAHSLRSWPFAGDGCGGKSIEHGGGYG